MYKKKFWEWETLSYEERRKNENESKRRWAKANPDKVRAYSRRNAKLYRERHPDRVKVTKQNDYAKNSAKYAERARAWRLANPERYRLLMAASYQRQKAIKKAPRCMECESLLKAPGSVYCDWCITTYKLCTTNKTQQSKS